MFLPYSFSRTSVLANLTWSTLVLVADTSVLAAPNNSSGFPRSLGSDVLEQEENRSSRRFENKPAPVFELPKLPEPNAESSIISQRLKIFCKRINLLGNTVFPNDELDRLTSPYLNREITNQDLQQLRLELSRYYVDRGYINSGAVIPDQDVRDGVIEIRIIEGRLDRVEIEGNNTFSKSYLEERINFEARDPLQLNRLQENLQLLLENPLVERINADLRPGQQPGTATLNTKIKERVPYQLGLGFDNQLAPSIGSYQGTAYASHRNLIGRGDVISVQGRFADGLTGYGVDYWLPINLDDTSIHAWFSHFDSNIVETPFNQIDVSSNSESYGVGLSHPFIRKPGQTLAGTLTIERRRSNTFLLGEPFSFSAGVQNGESSVSVIRIGQEWTERSTEQVFSVRSTFNVGVDALDATINQAAPDGRFFSWLGQLQWARRIWDAQIVWRTDVQAAKDALLPLEKFQIGGANSVRGYRENQLVRDWGFSSTLELRHPVFSDVFGREKFFIAPFADMGGAWNIHAETASTVDVLASVGLGVIWEPHSRFHSHLYWGKALVNVDNPERDPQDYGFHFKLSGQLF